MSKSSPKLHSQSGVSLIELIVVMVIIALVASLAFMSRGSANEQFQRQNASRLLKATLERARFDSVKRRAVGNAQMASVTLTSTSFTLRTDENVNGVITDSGDAVTTTVPPGITIQRHDGALFSPSNDNVVFDMRGELPPSAPPAQFIICNGTCPTVASLTPAIADILIVTPTGTVNLLAGSPNALPTFNNPSLAGSTSTTANINPDVTMP